MIQAIIEFWYEHQTGILFFLSIFMSFLFAVDNPLASNDSRNSALEGAKGSRAMAAMALMVGAAKGFIDERFGWSPYVTWPVAFITGMPLSMFIALIAMGVKIVLDAGKHEAKKELGEAKREINSRIDKNLEELEKRVNEETKKNL